MNTAAVGAKTARACDYCIRKRARWYCAADDAFLCQACDGSVHSANQLARRHERVRLNISSLKCSSEDKSCIPSWHRGVNRRVRTPRHPKHQSKDSSTTTTTSNDDDNNEEGDQLQLLYRVPVMDPFELDLNLDMGIDMDLNMDMDMEEFAADVETLLGKGIDGEMGLLDCHVKDEEEMMMMMNGHEMEVMGEPFELTFDYNSPASCDEGDVKVAKEEVDDEKRGWRMKLNLDYDAISSAWASHGSPWMNGEKPEINPNDCWLHNTMGGDSTVSIPLGGVGRIAAQGTSGDGGREARVTRYREKRRTRLFSKKIRYEVRKLNAEKRPRMKGRFVKRSSFNQLT